jgi:hypothetical protein
MSSWQWITVYKGCQPRLNTNKKKAIKFNQGILNTRNINVVQKENVD